MKRTLTAVICLLLLSCSLFTWPLATNAAGDPIEIQSYAVSGAYGVSNVYAITLHLKKWDPPVAGDKLYGLTVEAAAGSDFKQARASGSGYAISQTAVSLSNAGALSPLNSNETTYTAYFLKTGTSDSLTMQFHYQHGPDTSHLTEDTISHTVTVIKTTPDPTTGDPDPTPVDTTKYKPLLGVASDSALPLLTPETAVLTVPIKNSSSYSARDISIQLEPADPSRPFFTVNRMSVSASLSSISSNSTKNALFYVKLAPGATTGIHALKLTYSYSNSYGDDFTSAETAYVQVEAQNIAPRLAAFCSSTGISPGAETTVKFVIKNSGANDARNIKVTLLGLSASGVSLRNETDIKYLDKIAGQSSAEMEFKLYASPSLSDSSAMLQMKLDYTDQSGVSYSETNSVFLPLGSGGGDVSGVPRLIIHRYGFEPDEIRAGGEFLLQLDLLNTSRSKSINNLKVTITSDDGIFLPVDASNTLFTEQIAPQQIWNASLVMSTKADAENKSYSLRINVDYEANNGQAYSSQEVISIPVQQNPRLMVGDPQFYGEAYAYQMLPINVEFYNLGKTVLYNLMVKAEGPFQLEGGSYFVGNFNPGANDSFNFAVTPNAAGELMGSIIFSFEDSVGTPLEVRREFSLNVMEPFIPEDPGVVPPVEEKRPSALVYVGIGAVVLLALAVGAVWWLRRRKKRRISLQAAEDLVAAAQTDIPEIEYVGFEETDPASQETDATPKG